MKTLCFDIDGVICNNTWGDYEKAIPNKDVIKKINNLYEKGYLIKIFTARYMGRSNENIQGAYDLGFDFTHKQLRNWGIKFHELIMGKPSFDILIDDKAISYNTDWMNTLE
tara:strand:- start:138 stop:470 length:333 start_codon:yes stop_codon:yes gene_type:complete